MPPYPKRKKRRQEGGGQRKDIMPAADDHNNMPSFDDLSTDEVAIIFGYLPPADIMRARLNKKMREAATKTIVPPTNFVVNSVGKYNALVAMATALPNLQQITLDTLGYNGHKWSDVIS